ncbi:hypothetical protein ABKN59_006829 [Abortiporus biennis]
MTHLAVVLTALRSRQSNSLDNIPQNSTRICELTHECCAEISNRPRPSQLSQCYRLPIANDVDGVKHQDSRDVIPVYTSVLVAEGSRQIALS